MPDISPILLVIGVASVVIGAIVGWLLRGSRVKCEKDAIHASWKEQMSVQRVEHERLAEQNKNLMEQVSQFRGSRKDADGRAKELSDSLREALDAQYALKAEIRSLKSNLDVAVKQRDRVKRDYDRAASDHSDREALREKDSKIFNLSRELESWQKRLPPLLEKFRQRSLEVEQLEVELEKAKARIAVLEAHCGNDETRVESMGERELSENLDASNEQFDDEIPADAGNDVDDTEVPDDIAATSEEARSDATNAWAISSGPVAANGFPRDNLKLIKGVGPAIEKTLNDLGIHRFEQIADMSEVDIERVAEELRGFRNRIYREDWMGQARALRQNRDTQAH